MPYIFHMLPPKQRAERYRRLAAEVVLLAEEAQSGDVRAAYFMLAAAWKSLADKMESVERAGVPPLPDIAAAQKPRDEHPGDS